MFQEIASKIAKMQTTKPALPIIIFIIITALLTPGIFRLIDNVEPSIEKVLPSEIQEVKTMNNMRAQFGADMTYLLVHTDGPVTDARNPEFLKYIDILSEKLRERELILEVQNTADLIKKQNNEIIPNDINKIKSQLKKDPSIASFINPDYTFSVIRLKTDTGSSASRIGDVTDLIDEDILSLENINPGAKIQITGYNVIDKATFDVIISDFGRITAFSMVLVMIVVFITFKSIIKGFMPMIVVMNALIWTMGISGYLGLTLTVVSMVSAAMIMGLGIDFGIHIVHTYYEERKKHNPKKAITEMIKPLLRAMIAASLTTISGFLALLFGVLPAMKTLGIILALGILNTLIGAVFLLPTIIYLYDRKSKNMQTIIK